MISAKLKIHTAELAAKLREAGWEILEAEQPFEHEWWAAEFWRVRSIWSPRTVQLYLTFLVDPMGQPDDVWAVSASAGRPVQRPIGGEDPCMNLGHGWKEELGKFMEALSVFREPLV